MDYFVDKKERLWNKNYVKAWSANFMLFLSFMLLTPLLPVYLSERFGADKADIGIVLAGYTLTTLIIRPFSGYIVDNFPRKAVLLISYGIFALMFGGYLLAGSLLAFTVVRTLHGFPFGATTVSNSTVAIDVLPSSRRTEGIGFYGLSNNIATAIGPTIALFIFSYYYSYDLLFGLSLLIGIAGWCINSTLKLKERPLQGERPKMKLDRFVLVRGWSESLCMVCFAFSYGVLSTYIAIYGLEELGITGGTGLFFMLLAIGLMLSRITGSVSLRKGRIAENASVGMLVSLCGYFIFACFHNLWGYYGAALIIGLGNGHMYPAFQNMFINLAENNQRGTANSTLLVSWDIGVGLGVLLGGVISQYYGFHSAFWWGWIVNGIGVAYFFAYVRRHFLNNKLR
ncbi:MAG: MFS transporter [Clostridium sp.]|nr:MFS transporter [Clostridium sp.]